MIRDLVLYTELAEPTIGEVHLYLAAQQSLGTQTKNIARVLRAPMIDREQRRPCAPDDNQEPPHRDGTRKTGDPGRRCGVPSPPPPTQNAWSGRNHCST